MYARQAASATISCEADLQQVEQEILDGTHAVLDIDATEDDFSILGAAEIRRLVRAARTSGTQVRFITDDPLRQELIHILGGNTGNGTPAPLQTAPQHTAPVSSNDERTRKIGYVAAEMTAQAQPIARTTTRFNADEPSFSFVITPPTDARTAAAATAPATQPQSAAPRTPSNGKRRGPRILAGVALVATMLGIAALLAVFLLPAATVTLTPQVQDVSADITYGLAAPGTSWDLSIEPTPIEVTVSTQASLPTTGERFEPDGVAVGELRLTNAATSELLVPSGTQISTDDGTAFVTTADVVVPAADPFGTLTFGSALVAIQAVQAGPGGNVATEALVGQLDSGPFYSNVEPTNGGTNKRIQTVSQADIDSLTRQASDQINARNAGELLAKVPAGQELVTGSEVRDPITFSFNHQLGADATELSVNATQRIAASTFDPEALHAQARAQAADRISAAAGESLRVLPGSVAVGEPEAITSSATPAFALHISGKGQTLLDPALLAHLPQELRGMDVEDAQQLLESVPGVADVDVQSSPEWLPFGLPRRTSRIEVIIVQQPVDSSTTPSSQTTGP